MPQQKADPPVIVYTYVETANGAAVNEAFDYLLERFFSSK